MATYTWMASAYSMTSAIFWAIIGNETRISYWRRETHSTHAGPLSDALGRRWFFIAGNILALIGSIVCSTAHSVRVVIIGMAFAGAGAAHQQMALAALAEIYPNKYRGLVQGKCDICWVRASPKAQYRSVGNRATSVFCLWLSDCTFHGQTCNLEMGLLP